MKTQSFAYSILIVGFILYAGSTDDPGDRFRNLREKRKRVAIKNWSYDLAISPTWLRRYNVFRCSRLLLLLLNKRRYFLNILTRIQKRRVFYPPFKKVQTLKEQTTTTKELGKTSLSLSLSLVRLKSPLNLFAYLKKGMKCYAPNYPICCQPFSAISPLPSFNSRLLASFKQV